MKKAAVFIVLIISLAALVSCKPMKRDPAAIAGMKPAHAASATEGIPLSSPDREDLTLVQKPAGSIAGQPPETDSLTPEPTQETTPEPTPLPTPEPTPEPKTFKQLAPTTTMPFGELVGDNGIYEDITRYPASGTYRVVVDLYHQVVMAYSQDEAGEYCVPERYMVCTTGGPKDPTPGGEYRAGTHRPRFGKFYNDGVYGQYWTQIVGRIYFHSLLYTQRSAGAYTSSSYKLLGKRGSHGCIRLLVPDARWIYYHIAPGTIVEIRTGSKDDAETASIKEQLVRAPLPESRPQVHGLPNTDVWSIEELNEQLLDESSYTLPDGTTISAYGDEYSSGGKLQKFGKLTAEGQPD